MLVRLLLFLAAIVHVHSDSALASLGTELKTGIAKLNSYDNVELIGYVHTSYATRSEAEVDADVASYAQWSTYRQQNLNISGIFFDEAPSKDDQTLIQYMQRVSRYARAQKLSTIVFNPGTKVQNSTYFKSANLIVEVENDYSQWTSNTPAEMFTSSHYYPKDAVILYNAPLDADYNAVVNEATYMGLGAAFLTNSADYTTVESVPKVAEAFAQT